MENLDKIHQLIEQYFDKTLTGADQQIVEEKLVNDPEFIKAFETEKAILKAIDYKGNQELRPMLDQIYKEEVLGESNSAKIRSISRLRIISIAASALILVAAGMWVFLRAPLNDRLYTAYYETPNPSTFRDDQATINEDILTAYEQADFSSAIPLLESLEESGNASSQDILLLGICYLETQRFAEAEQHFLSLENDNNWKDSGQWYYALTLLQQDKVEAAREVLSQLADGSTPTAPERQRKASELLEKLK